MTHRALAVAALLALPAGALAQPAPPAQPASATPPAAELSPIEVEAARRLFREGVAFAQQARWAEARVKFEGALAIRPAPIVRFNLAVACQNTNQLVRAVSLYRDYLRETPREDDPARVDAAAREIDALGRRVARLRIVVTGDQVRSLALDGHPLNVALIGVDIPVDPGAHFVEVTGAAGDRTRHDGGFFEGDSVTVPIELDPTPPAAHAAADWTPRTRSFGRQITRPGPDGRWVDWAARATAAPVSLWRQRPFTVGLQVGYGAPAGVAALSFRYAPQPWFAAELAAGAFGAYGPSGVALAHLRYPGERFAIGAFAGLGVGRAAVTTSCTPSSDRTNATCPAASTRDVSFYALTVSAGLSAELRLGSRLTLRALAGARFLTNPADARAMDDRAARPDCARSSIEGDVCPVYRNASEAVTANALVALDLGYTF